MRLLWAVLFLVVTTSCAPADADHPPVPVGETRRTADALSLLREWDRHRSQTWAAGDVAALTDLYTRASRTGDHDGDMLAAYAARGLRVTGLRTQVLDASLRSWTPDRITLEVTDRVVGAQAVGRGVRISLPRDRPSTRVISLRRVSGAWRVEEVTEAGHRRPSTS
ncbi:MAG TPA: hypothetical protein VFG98_14965 [Intrasporangium sp.]|nr:hypothetical protein [Intrasporangium sp.]